MAIPGGPPREVAEFSIFFRAEQAEAARQCCRARARRFGSERGRPAPCVDTSRPEFRRVVATLFPVRALPGVGLQHAHAIAFRVVKGNISTDSGYLQRLPENLAA